MVKKMKQRREAGIVIAADILHRRSNQKEKGFVALFWAKKGAFK